MPFEEEHYILLDGKGNRILRYIVETGNFVVLSNLNKANTKILPGESYCISVYRLDHPYLSYNRSEIIVPLSSGLWNDTF